MTNLKNARLLKTIAFEPVDATPIWIMRQAGRYLPEYRKVREQAGSFMQLCKTPELACEVTLQPIRRFPLDAAILFSDILTIPDAMGLGLYFKEGEGPQFTNRLHSTKDILRLSVPDPDLSLRYVLDAIQLIQQELKRAIPLIGFCGSPWTLSCYMIEGRAGAGFPLIQNLMHEDSKILHHLLNILAQAVAAHLNAQIAAGVDVVMIFDTWGGLLSTENYRIYSLNYIQEIINQLRNKVPVILFTKNGGQWLKMMSQLGAHVLGVDWLTNLKEARNEVGSHIALQGNLNPAVLLQSEEELKAEVARILADYGKGSGHIFNLGHGITPDVNPEQVALLVDTVHTLSKPYHE